MILENTWARIWSFFKLYENTKTIFFSKSKPCWIEQRHLWKYLTTEFRWFYGKAIDHWTGCETKPPILEWDKTADFKNGTKSPILKTGQNRRFWKRDKIADFENGTKSPILKTGQNRRFWLWDKTADFKVGQNGRFVIIQIASLCKDKSCSR